MAAAPFKIRLMAPRSCCHYLPHLAASVAATSFLDQERGRGPIGCCSATVRAHPQGTLSENDRVLVWEKWLRDSEGRRATPPVRQVACGRLHVPARRSSPTKSRKRARAPRPSVQQLGHSLQRLLPSLRFSDRSPFWAHSNAGCWETTCRWRGKACVPDSYQGC